MTSDARAVQAVESLMEHFDSVIIFATRVENGATAAIVKRGGDYYACKGITQEWLDDERNKELVIRLKSED